MTEEKQFRITNARGRPEYVAINDGLPDNDITRTKADFIVDEADWRATMRQAAVAELMDVAKTLPPEGVIAMLDLMVENMDLPNRDELVKRIRAINGQRDPDAAEPTPEEQQQMQAAAAQQQMQAELAMAQLREQQAKAAKTEADAMVAAAKAKQIEKQAVREGVGAIKDATDAAQAVAFLPELAPLADSMLQESGWATPEVPAPTAALPAPQDPSAVAPHGAAPDGTMQPPM